MKSKFLSAAGLFGVLWLVVPTANAQYYSGGATLECESRDYRFTRCANWGDARIVRQTSEAPCRRGHSWGVDRRGLWVDKGCAGLFRDAGYGGGRGDGHGHGGGYGGGGGWHPGPGWDSTFTVRCASHDYNYNFCAVDLGGGGRAYLDRQISSTACIEGRTWGANRAGVWVEGGCEGVFRIQRRWR